MKKEILTRDLYLLKLVESRWSGKCKGSDEDC